MKKIVLSVIVGVVLLGCGGSSGGGGEETEEKVNPHTTDKNIPDIYGKSVISIMNNYPRGGYGEDAYDRVYLEKVLVNHNVFCTDYQYTEDDLTSHVEKYDGRQIEKVYQKNNSQICSELTFTEKNIVYEADSTVIYYNKD